MSPEFAGSRGDLRTFFTTAYAQSLAEKKGTKFRDEIDPIKELVEKYGDALLMAAEEGDDETLRRILETGVPANLPHPISGATALHLAAAHGARPILRALQKYGDLDFLAKDRKGRRPSHLADVYGDDPAMARFLILKEKQQARAMGISLPSRRKQNPA